MTIVTSVPDTATPNRLEALRLAMNSSELQFFDADRDLAPLENDSPGRLVGCIFFDKALDPPDSVNPSECPNTSTLNTNSYNRVYGSVEGGTFLDDLPLTTAQLSEIVETVLDSALSKERGRIPDFRGETTVFVTPPNITWLSSLPNAGSLPLLPLGTFHLGNLSEFDGLDKNRVLTGNIVFTGNTDKLDWCKTKLSMQEYALESNVVALGPTANRSAIMLIPEQQVEFNPYKSHISITFQV